MNGLTVSLVTTLVTIIISLLVAIIVKLMTLLLDKIAAPPKKTSDTDTLVFSDESDIAAVIAIAQSSK
jgi:hypothetical protein